MGYSSQERKEAFQGSKESVENEKGECMNKLAIYLNTHPVMDLLFALVISTLPVVPFIVIGLRNW